MFIQFIRIPIISAYPVDLDENSIFGFTIITSGSYGIIPYANDSFENYPSGFRTSFSGAGFWNGSGYTLNHINYIYDTFDSYITGQNIYNYYTGFHSGIDISGYYIFGASGFPVDYKHTGVIKTSFFYEDFSLYNTGYQVSMIFTGAKEINTAQSYTGYPNSQYFNIFLNISGSKSCVGNVFSTGLPPYSIPYIEVSIGDSLVFGSLGRGWAMGGQYF